jgi:hypothetical protein
MKKILLFVVLVIVLLTATGCYEADRASENLSRAADQFEITRRITFYNGITGEFILVIEGLCSLGNYDSAGELSVTCKVSPTEYKKHFLGLSDNVTYFAEQIEPSEVSAYRYRVIFSPTTLIPDLELDMGW